jgi:hypothetical protein
VRHLSASALFVSNCYLSIALILALTSPNNNPNLIQLDMVYNNLLPTNI